MIQKLKRAIMVAMVSSGLLMPAMVPAFVGTVAADNIVGGVCNGVNQAANGTTSSNCGTAGTTAGGTADLHTIAAKVVNIFSIIVGIVAVIMTIYGGFRYITSGGESGKVGTAKNTLIYAIIGLIIVALAQFIVHYVLNTTTSSTAGLGQ